MRSGSAAREALARWTLIAGLAALAAGCSSLPFLGGKAKVRVILQATPNCNDCGKSLGAPLRYRILQVKDATVLGGASITDLWDKEDKLLGAAFISRSQDAVIEPGASKELAVDLDPATRGVVVYGDFCRTDGSCWHYVRARDGGGSVRLYLIADATCLRPRR